MKKLLLFLFMSSLSIVYNYGQDSIFLKNNSIIKAKILEINRKEINYKLFDNQDGPTYSMNKKQINFIKYNNNYIESFDRKRYRKFEQKQIIDTTLHRFLLGAGLSIGVFNPDDYYDYINRYAEYYNLQMDEIDNSAKNINFGIHGLVGVKFTKTFSMNLFGEYNSNEIKVYNDNHYGNTFYLTKKTFGINGNEEIPINRKLGINIEEGITYNDISFYAKNKNLLSGDNIGFRLQGGLNFYFSKHFTLQGLIGLDYANVTKQNFDMDYTGLLFSINMIFNK
jgi:hypothetical protein